VKRLAVTLQPGEKYRYGDETQSSVVTILDGQEPVTRAGVGWFKYWAECEGQRGYVIFGQTGIVDVIEEGE
jgi:hypothetical protein